MLVVFLQLCLLVDSSKKRQQQCSAGCTDLQIPPDLTDLVADPLPPLPPLSPAANIALQRLDIGDYCDFDRRANLSLSDFLRDYAQPRKPVVLIDLADDWPAMEWGRVGAFEKGGPALKTVQTIVRAFQWGLERNPQYQTPQVSNCLAKSLYLDLNKNPQHKLVRKMVHCGYSTPDIFRTDFFRACSKVYNKSYARRWLLIASAGSGSCFHIDPFNTSAWNTVLTGSKRWAMYPPDRTFPPPGTNGRESVPYSAQFQGVEAERGKVWGISSPWGLAESDQGPRHYFEAVLPRLSEGARPLQCMLRRGETLYIPSGWQHQVLNTAPSLAITENFMHEANIESVMGELAKRPSGTQPRKCMKRIAAALLARDIEQASALKETEEEKEDRAN
jgi:hypothetical protein